MFTIKQMKQAARTNLQFWRERSIGISLLVSLPLIACAFLLLFILFFFTMTIFNAVIENHYRFLATLLTIAIPLAAGGLMALFYSMITAVCEVGFARFFLKRRGMLNPSSGEAFAPFCEGHYKNIAAARLTTNLIIFLGSLFFIIPGILFALQFSMVPFVLAADGTISGSKARAYSDKLMKNHWGKLFVLYLSFFGWIIVSGFTFGILTVTYVYPYLTAALAEFYSCRRAELISQGELRPDELPSFGRDWYSQNNLGGPFGSLGFTPPPAANTPV